MIVLHRLPVLVEQQPAMLMLGVEIARDADDRLRTLVKRELGPAQGPGNSFGREFTDLEPLQDLAVIGVAASREIAEQPGREIARISERAKLGSVGLDPAALHGRDDGERPDSAIDRRFEIHECFGESLSRVRKSSAFPIRLPLASFASVSA